MVVASLNHWLLPKTNHSMSEKRRLANPLSFAKQHKQLVMNWCNNISVVERHVTPWPSLLTLGWALAARSCSDNHTGALLFGHAPMTNWYLACVLQRFSCWNFGITTSKKRSECPNHLRYFLPTLLSLRKPTHNSFLFFLSDWVWDDLQTPIPHLSLTNKEITPAWTSFRWFWFKNWRVWSLVRFLPVRISRNLCTLPWSRLRQADCS